MSLRASFEDLSELILDTQGDPKTKAEIIKKIREEMAGCLVCVPALFIKNRDEKSKRIKHAVSEMSSNGFSRADISKSIAERFGISITSAYSWISKTNKDMEK